MHDPMVVAFSIRRPWPEKPQNFIVRKRTPKWRIGATPFWYLNGTEYHFPSLITVWHNEPGGADSGTVCHWRDSHWRLHVHHWSLQIHPWQGFCRWAFTRCAWCGEPSRKGDVVNHSRSWGGGPKRPFWQGRAEIYHSDCVSVVTAHSQCYCETPTLNHGDYGQCQRCGRFRAWRREPSAADRLLSKLRIGERMSPELRAECKRLWAEGRKVAEQAAS